jgi:hypothetical protein
MHAWEHASSLQACTHLNVAAHAAFAAHADPCVQHELWMHVLQSASDAPKPPHEPPWLLLPVVALLEHAATRTAIARQTTDHCTLGRTTTPSSPRAPIGVASATNTHDPTSSSHVTEATGSIVICRNAFGSSILAMPMLSTIAGWIWARVTVGHGRDAHRATFITVPSPRLTQ